MQIASKWKVEVTGIDIEKVYKRRERLRQIVSKIDFHN